MTVASTPLLAGARRRRTPMGRHLADATALRSPEAWVADLEAAFGEASPLRHHVPHLVPTKGALDRLFTRAQRLGRR
jgi:hypothetical protein